MTHRYGSPGVGERMVAKGLAGRGRNLNRFRHLATHATRSIDPKSVDVNSPFEQEDSYSPMTDSPGYQIRAHESNRHSVTPSAHAAMVDGLPTS
jgi:hypothetical protein